MGEKQPPISKLTALSRVDFILNSARQGKPVEEVQKIIQANSSCEEDVRGNLSVENVGRAISTLPFVTSIFATKPGGHDDVRDRRDLIVLLDGQIVPGVGIQVKSSAQAMINFYKRYSSNQEKAKQILISRKLILLNGQLPDEAIVNFFKNKLSEINNYFQTQPEDKRKFYFLEKSIERKIK